MDYKNNDVIFKRFNSAVYDLALAESALRKDNKDLFTKHLRDAGEAISQSLEFSLKNHLERKLSSKERKNFNIEKGNLHRLIEKYIDVNGNDNGYLFLTIDNTIEPDVDFKYLKDAKYLLTNAAKHKGTEPDFQVQKKYLEEVRKFIYQYIDSEKKLKTIQDYEKVDLSTWDLLYTACDRFSSEERNYILIIGENKNIDHNYLKSLSIPKWNMVIDFDYNSNEIGLFHSAYSSNNIPPHKIKSSDLVDVNSFSRFSQSHYHFYANSYNGSGDTETNSYLDWNKKYGKKTEIFLKSYAEVLSNQKNIIVILYNSRRHVNFLCEKIEQYFGNNTTYIFANDFNDELLQVCEDFDGVKVNISIPEISEGLANVSSNFGVINPQKGQMLIPFMEKSQTETSGVLTESEYAQLEEYFEVVHKGLPDNNNEEKDRRSFLVGENRISWHGLKNRFDVENFRSNKKLIKAVEKVIENGRGKIQLVHEAGFGGTTIARRIAWEIHNDYPTLILKKYRDSKVKESLIKLHEKTRKTIFVVMEAPQTITLDEVDSLFKSIPQARPIVFLIVKRGKPNSNDLVVSDWGNDTTELINAYKPYIKEYTSEEVRLRKVKELDEILYSQEAYKKTPFYIGLLTFEEKFFALKDYINNFVLEVLEKEEQKRVLLFLSLCNDYLGQGLPSSFFRTLFKVSGSDVIELEKYFSKESTIVESLLLPYQEGNYKFWTIKHNFFAKELKKQILSGNSENPEIWRHGLADICVKFIYDSSSDSSTSEYVQEILQKLFIGNRKDRAGEDFTTIINDIVSLDGKEQVFVTLKETYPDNPHYCSHLARFYSYHNKNREKALQYANEAILLSEIDGYQDSLLYHIKGMCLRSIAYDEMEKHRSMKLKGKSITNENFNEVIDKFVPEAAIQFELSREIAKKQNRIDEYGFIAHIQLLIAAIDYAITISGKGKAVFLAQSEEPFAEWLDLSESLLEEVKRVNLDDDESGKIEDCVNDIMAFYENYEQILQNLRSQLEKGKNPTRTRRQIVRTYFRKKIDFANDMKLVTSILSLMEQNIDNEPDNEKNFYLWFKAARYSSVSLDDAINKLAKWKVNSNAVDSIYYFYILKVIRALQGYSEATMDAFNLIKECKSKGKSQITVFEWYGKGQGLAKLINRDMIRPENKGEKLELVEGYFTDYTHDGRGIITIANKLDVFFSPIQAKLTSDDQNQPVEFYLGFSYDGLRADSYSVRIKGTEPRNNEPCSENLHKVKVKQEKANKRLKILGKIDLPENKANTNSKNK